MARLHSSGAVGGGAGLRSCRAPENPNSEALKKSLENLSKQRQLAASRCFCGPGAFSKFSRGWASWVWLSEGSNFWRIGPRCFDLFWLRGRQAIQFFCISMYVCCCALWLPLATMICLGHVFVLIITNHPKFFISMYVCCCALWLLCATMICVGSSFAVLKTNHQVFFIPTYVCVVVLSGCCLLP